MHPGGKGRAPQAHIGDQRPLFVGLDGDADAHIGALSAKGGAVGAGGQVHGVTVIAGKHDCQQLLIKGRVGLQPGQKAFLVRRFAEQGLQGTLQRSVAFRAFQPVFPDEGVHLLQKLQLLSGGQLTGKGGGNDAEKQDCGQQGREDAFFHGNSFRKRQEGGPERPPSGKCFTYDPVPKRRSRTGRFR